MNIKKIASAVVTLASVIALTACGVDTTSGCENSVMNYVSTSEYSIPSSIEAKIEAKEKTIVITEFIKGSSNNYNKTAVEVSSFIKSAQEKMLAENYELISSDTNSMGEYGTSISVTLIFQKQQEITKPLG